MRDETSIPWFEAAVVADADAGMVPGDSVPFVVSVTNWGPLACRVGVDSECSMHLRHSTGKAWSPPARVVAAMRQKLLTGTPGQTSFSDELNFPQARSNPTTDDVEQVEVTVRRGTETASMLDPLPILRVDIPLRPPA